MLIFPVKLQTSYHDVKNHINLTMCRFFESILMVFSAWLKINRSGKTLKDIFYSCVKAFSEAILKFFFTQNYIHNLLTEILKFSLMFIPISIHDNFKIFVLDAIFDS